MRRLNFDRNNNVARTFICSNNGFAIKVGTNKVQVLFPDYLKLTLSASDMATLLDMFQESYMNQKKETLELRARVVYKHSVIDVVRHGGWESISTEAIERYEGIVKISGEYRSFGYIVTVDADGVRGEVLVPYRWASKRGSDLRRAVRAAIQDWN